MTMTTTKTKRGIRMIGLYIFITTDFVFVCFVCFLTYVYLILDLSI